MNDRFLPLTRRGLRCFRSGIGLAALCMLTGGIQQYVTLLSPAAGLSLRWFQPVVASMSVVASGLMLVGVLFITACPAEAGVARWGIGILSLSALASLWPVVVYAALWPTTGPSRRWLPAGSIGTCRRSSATDLALFSRWRGDDPGGVCRGAVVRGVSASVRCREGAAPAAGRPGRGRAAMIQNRLTISSHCPALAGRGRELLEVVFPSFLARSGRALRVTFPAPRRRVGCRG